MKDIQVLHVFCVSCQRLRSCSLEVFRVSESTA
nr:MAG TPA: Molybdenum Cofactor Synthesis C [Caudoviricetes sp.]